MKTKDFKVRVKMPPNVSFKEMADFIRECVSNPVNPRIRMDWDKVTVKPIKDTPLFNHRTLDGILNGSWDV